MADISDHHKLKVVTLALGMLAVASLIAVMSLPPFTNPIGGQTSMLTVHLLLELIAVIISVLVVTVSWHTFDGREALSAKVLICGFLIVACCDLVHALTYDGMPAFLTESSTPRAIFFWLMGRTFEVATMALVSIQWKAPLSRKFWLGMGLVVSGVLIWFGSYRIDAFPVTFVKGHGVTEFKANYEYVLCFLNIVVAILLWYRGEHTGKSRYYLLALSSFVMGVGEISFTAYVAPSDFQNIFGHAYKLAAYSLLYWATFVTSIRAPFEEIRQSEIKLRESETRYYSALSSLSEGVVIHGSGGEILTANHAAGSILGLTVEQIEGRSSIDPRWQAIHEDGTPWLGDTHPAMVALQTGKAVTKAIMGIQKPDGSLAWILVNAEPIVIPGEQVPHQVVASFTDITLSKQAESDLRIAATAFESQEGMMITDAKGVILRVNKAFTESTGYTVEEAVGQTPRLLKSGRHDADFYRAMWETIHRTGTWQGEIWDRRKNGEIYPKWLTITAVKGSDCIVTHYVGTHIDITERKSAEKEIQLLAYYDPLTRLPNRRLLMDRLQQALASSARIGRKGGLLLIDLDNFKTLNDTLGHQIGDLLLQQVAQRLASCVREGDTVARLGGDEFVVLLEGLSEKSIEAAAQTEAIGEKILAALSQPYQLAMHEHQSTTSIGATLFNDNHLATDELMKQADIAMYQAKKAGRNTLRFFDPQMQASISARVSLEGELRKALERQQFHLNYQIQVGNSLRPLGAEALIRWIHPERGPVSPAQFIPLAEETGLIIPIGQWVLETACAQIKAWQQDELARDLTLAVNVSAKQFRQADFVAQVQAAIQRHAIKPMLLKLELTEGMLLENIEDTIATMNTLNEIGVQFSLDDFGTGYSSLQYLKRLPLDQLKIDQSFVRDIATDSSDLAIVRTIIAVAQSLDMSVIAEGVETEEQRQLLLKNGCTNYQGYLFGRPVPIEQFEAKLKQG